MAVNVICDGTTYQGISTITAGGKSFALSETGGGFEPVSGYTDINAINTVSLSMAIGTFETNKFLVLVQLVESGTYATSGDPTSALTLDADCTGINTGTWSLYSIVYFTEIPRDTSVTYQQSVEWPNVMYGRITTGNKNVSPTTWNPAVIQSYSNGVLTLSNVGCSTGSATKHFKYKWTVYPM